MNEIEVVAPAFVVEALLHLVDAVFAWLIVGLLFSIPVANMNAGTIE